MRIAKLHMDPQDKTRFEILGKSSVKYHLKANHAVEAKRWFWALNNAIQWTKDEAKEEARQKERKEEMLRQAKSGKPSDTVTAEGSRFNSQGLAPATAMGMPLTATSSRASFQGSERGGGSVMGDDEMSVDGFQDLTTVQTSGGKSTKGMETTTIAADMDDEEEYGDDASSHELQPASKDAFNITAHSASLQLNLLSQVSSALQVESRKSQAMPISDPTVIQALSTYESAVASLQSLVDDLLKISRDRDAYWQYRLDRETDVRRLWEDSMAKVAKEQEELEGRMVESEVKRKRTKKALKDVLDGEPPQSGILPGDDVSISKDMANIQLHGRGTDGRKKSIGARDPGRRKSTIASLTNLSDSDSEQDEEFFDAVDAGEIEVVDTMPSVEPNMASAPPKIEESQESQVKKGLRDEKQTEIEASFKGYEDPVRTRLKMDADDRPKISLWVCSSSNKGDWHLLTS